MPGSCSACGAIAPTRMYRTSIPFFKASAPNSARHSPASSRHGCQAMPAKHCCNHLVALHTAAALQRSLHPGGFPPAACRSACVEAEGTG